MTPRFLPEPLVLAAFLLAAADFGARDVFRTKGSSSRTSNDTAAAGQRADLTQLLRDFRMLLFEQVESGRP